MKPQRILLAGWLGFMFIAYPGFMKSDAPDMLVDSRTGDLTSVHSAMMELVWRIVGYVLSGTPGMLVVQSVLLLLGSYALLRRIATDRTAAILADVVLLVPPLMLTTALISPESTLASFLVAGAALLASERRWHRLVGLGLLVFASGLRAGGALAVIPVIVIGFRWTETPRRIVRIGIATAAALAVIGLAFAIERAIVEIPSDRDATRLAMDDIAGSLAHSPPLAPDVIRDALAGVELVPSAADDPQARARALGEKHLLFDDPEQGLFAPAEGNTQRDAIRAARWPIIRATPGGYLAYRWHFFKRVIGLTNQKYPTYYTVFVVSHDQATAIAHQARHSLLQSSLLRIVRPISKTFLFRPYYYLFVALVMLPLALKRRQVLASTLLASGLLYAIALMFAATRAEYRDSHWLAVSTILALVVLVQGMRSQSRADVEPRPG